MTVTKEVHGSWVALTGTQGEIAAKLDEEKVQVHQTIGMSSPTTDKITVLYKKGP